MLRDVHVRLERRAEPRAGAVAAVDDRQARRCASRFALPAAAAMRRARWRFTARRRKTNAATSEQDHQDQRGCAARTEPPCPWCLAPVATVLAVSRRRAPAARRGRASGTIDGVAGGAARCVERRHCRGRRHGARFGFVRAERKVSRTPARAAGAASAYGETATGGQDLAGALGVAGFANPASSSDAGPRVAAVGARRGSPRCTGGRCASRSRRACAAPVSVKPVLNPLAPA